MRKTLLTLASATAIAAAAMAVPTTADAHCNGCGVAAGLVGGLAAGALIGSAMANSPPPPAPPPPDYEPYPAYAGPVPVACPDGYWARRPFYDRWGHVVGWSRPYFFCP